jgi:hypothetical protein
MNNPVPLCAADNLACVNATKRQVSTIAASVDTIAKALEQARVAARALAVDQHPLAGINDQSCELQRLIAATAASLAALRDKSSQLVAESCGAHYAASLAAQDELAQAPADSGQN